MQREQLDAAPAPFHVPYQARGGFSAFTITVIFAADAVVASLFLAGHISDRFRRRRGIAPAGLFNGVAALNFMVWPDLPRLLLARFISGLGIGLPTGTGAARMTELHSVACPGTGSRRAAAMIAFVGFGMFGFFTSPAPSFVSRLLGTKSHLVAGVVAFVATAGPALVTVSITISAFRC